MNKVAKRFDFEGKNYEVKSHVSPMQRQFAVFCRGKRVNGYTYSVANNEITIPDEFLIDLAQADVVDGVWETNLKAWRTMHSTRARLRQ